MVSRPWFTFKRAEHVILVNTKKAGNSRKYFVFRCDHVREIPSFVVGETEERAKEILLLGSGILHASCRFISCSRRLHGGAEDV